MSLFDGVNHSFTTVSTGGFSPHQASIGHYESAHIEWIAVVGMVLAGGNFTLHYRALRRNPNPLLRSTELRLGSSSTRAWCRLEIYPVILALSVVTLRAPKAARRIRGRT